MKTELPLEVALLYYSNYFNDQRLALDTQILLWVQDNYVKVVVRFNLQICIVFRSSITTSLHLL
jgi:hypothetical protein